MCYSRFIICRGRIYDAQGNQICISLGVINAAPTVDGINAVLTRDRLQSIRHDLPTMDRGGSE